MENMNPLESSYDRLQKAFTRALVSHLLRSGPVIPMLLLWIAGLLLLLIVGNKPTLAVIWSALVMGLGVGAVTTSWLSLDVRKAVLGQLLTRQLRLPELKGNRVRQDVRSAVEVMIQVVLLSLKSRPTRDVDLQRRGLGNVYDALGLHAEAELSGALSREQRQVIATETMRLLTLAKRTVSDSALQREVIAAPHRLVEFLRETEAGVAKVLAIWSASYEGRLDRAAGPDKGLKHMSDEIPTDLWDRRNNLHDGFVRIDFQAGQAALDHLDDRYERLLFVLKRKREGDPIVVAEIPPLAEEAYRQAISALEDVLDLAHGVHLPDRERLAAEAVALEADVDSLTERGETGERLLIRQERLSSHRERLRAIERQELSIEALLHECERCEACLDRTRMEIASLKGESAALGITAVTETLRGTVDRARNVQDELKHLAN